MEVPTVAAEQHPSDPRGVAGAGIRGQLTTQAEIDRAVTAILDHCRQTGRGLREVAADILAGHLTLEADTVRAPHPGGR